MMGREVVARLSSHGHTFEILVDSEKVQEYLSGRLENLRDALISDAVFRKIRTPKAKEKALMMDVKETAERVEEGLLQKMFGTADFLAVAERIVRDGDIQYTTEQRRDILERKRRKIINSIASRAMDPRTKAPYTPARIESAMEEAKVSIDMNLSAESQVKDVVKAVSAVVPINLEEKKLELRIPVKYAGAARAVIQSRTEMLKEDWYGEHWTVLVRVGAGMVDELYGKLNSITRGELVSREVEK